MRLEIIRKQHNNTMFHYCDRTYITEDEDLIMDFLNDYYDEKKNLREWVEYALPMMTCIGNNMSLGYEESECMNVDYNLCFINDKGLKHYVRC